MGIGIELKLFFLEWRLLLQSEQEISLLGPRRARAKQ